MRNRPQLENKSSLLAAMLRSASCDQFLAGRLRMSTRTQASPKPLVCRCFVGQKLFAAAPAGGANWSLRRREKPQHSCLCVAITLFADLLRKQRPPQSCIRAARNKRRGLCGLAEHVTAPQDAASARRVYSASRVGRLPTKTNREHVERSWRAPPRESESVLGQVQ